MNEIHEIGRMHLSRRQLVTGIGVAGLATIIGVGTASRAVADNAGTGASGGNLRLENVAYDQKNFKFRPVVLSKGSSPERWQRRSSPCSAWRDVELAAGGPLVVQVTWRDVGAEYRAIGPVGNARQHFVVACPSLVGLDPAAFGAVGDGVTDDTTALNQAAAAAAAQLTGVDLNGRSYRVSDQIKLVPGITAFFGGTIRQSGSTPSPIYFEGKREGHASNLSGCVVCDVTIELSGLDTAHGIGGASPSHIAVVNCTISNPDSAGTALYIRNDMAGLENTSDIVVRGNTIDIKDSLGRAIEIGTPFNILGLPDMPTFWKTYWVAPDKFFTLSDVYIADNTISGGYYAISAIALQDFTIEGNTATLNIRNVSAQSGCLRGVIQDNIFQECVSSSIHLAYGSSDCRIADNTITTSRAIGEGVLQAYVGSKNNLFIGNTVSASHPSGPRWHIYAGVHADGNRFESNKLSGTCSKAYIAVEAAWDSTNTHLAHRASGVPETDGFANANTDNVQLIDNEIAASSAVEYICLADIADANGSYFVTSPVLAGNHLQGSTLDIAPHQYLG